MLPSQKSPEIEVKMLQRCENGDLNVILLYAFFLIKYVNSDFKIKGKSVLDDPTFDRNFISKCFYCGCTPELSGQPGITTVLEKAREVRIFGRGISYFIIRKVSFASLFLRIKKKFPNEKDSYVKAIFKSILKPLVKALHIENSNAKNSEQILIYDDLHKKSIKLSRSVSEKSMNKFVETLSCSKEKKDLIKDPDDFSVLYDAIKIEVCAGSTDDIKIYYTLYDKVPSKGSSLEISDKFVFCKKDDDRSQKGCITRSYIQENIFSKAPDNRELKELYNFVGLGKK
jgi:hypothetical protein